jgi:translocation and assembly module TamB
MAHDPVPVLERPRRRRWWLYSLFAVTLVAGLLVLGVAWLVATPGGARLVLDRVATFLGQGTTLGGVEGSFAGTLRIKSVEVKRPDLFVRIDDLEIERDPASSWWGRAVFRKVHAARVEVRTASSAAAARVPLTFEAPYPLRVEDARAGELRIGALAKEGALAGADLVFSDVRVRGEGDERSWKLEQASASTPWGSVNLSGTLATTAPYTLDLAGDITGERGDLRYKVTARVGGTLERMEAKFEGAERDLELAGTAILEPFKKPALRAATLRTRDLDLRRFGDLPRTRLTVEANLEPTPNGFAGPVRIVNSDPGPLDRERLPILSAAGRVAWVDQAGEARVEVADARFDLSGGGAAQGTMRWRPGRLEAQWRVAAMDLAQWHTTLRPTRLTGTISALSEREANRFEVALKEPRFEVQGKAVLAQGRLDVQAVQVKHAGGMVEAKGFVATQDRRDFRFEGRATHFDPAAFAKAASGDLNFDFVASGALSPSLAGDMRIDLAPSRFAGLPASGNVRLAGDAQRIAAADVKVTLGNSRLEAKGAFGRPGDALRFLVHAPDLASVAKPFGIAVAGALDAQGTLTGTFAAPGGQVALKGANLVLPSGIRMVALEGRADVATQAEGRVDATFEARGLARRSGETTQTLAERATLAIQGTRASHRAEAVAMLAKDAELRAAFAGGLDPRAPRLLWRGQLASLSLTGPSALSLAAPATLVAAADRVELGDATLKGTWGEARLALTRWTPALLELRGSSPGIGVRNAARALRLPTVPRGSLAVAAQWDLRAAETVDGTASISRVSGDLRIGEPPQPLGLEEMTLRLDVRRGQAKASALVRGARVGRVTAEVNATLRHVRAGLGIVDEAPIDGRIDAEMESIAWTAAWLGPEARVDGAVSAHLALSGTAHEPRWSGRVAAQDVRVREPQTGFEIENGAASLRLSDRSVVVESLSAQAPWRLSERAQRALPFAAKTETGTLSAQGAIDLGSRTGAITIKAAALPVTQLPTRFLALSGEAKLEARSEGLLATGAFKADAGWIAALATPLPSVSEDVVVVRKSTAADERRGRERIRMDVRFNLGDRVVFQGRGLNTRLAGELRVAGEPGAGLRATGSIRTVEGTYDAYGQKLSIEHGTLTFFGSLENPSLNVLALRKGLPVEAGVEVFGNVSRPRVRLVSLPEVPDPEKISWLVLGRGPGDVSQGEAATLVAAATAILGRGAGAGDIAQRFGFDEVRIGRSDTMSALGTLPQSTVAGKTGSASAAEVVTVGKRLSKDIYVVYEQGLADAEGALRIAWQITQHFQLLLRAGYLPGVDAVYRWTFE